MLERLFEISGKFETLCKRTAYSRWLPTEKLRTLYHKVFRKKGEAVVTRYDDIDYVFEYIKSLGIKKGDILIVHSSMEGMRRIDPKPEKVIDFLLELVGDEGTLVFPAFPICNAKYDEGKVATYDPKRTLCWTGMLPNCFLKYPQVVRSFFPYNSLAAKGKCSDEMMKNNLESNTPHGKNSAWEYCVNNHAKILYLGIKVAECNTILHAAEDILGEKWPIDNWYQQQTYKIKTGEGIIDKTIKVADSSWIKYSACHHYTAHLRKLKYIREDIVCGINIGFAEDSKEMVEYVINEAANNRIRYNIPKRYWKK